MKLNPRLYLILVVVVAVIVLALGFAFIVMPEKNKVSDLEEQISTTKSDISKEQGRQAQLQAYEKDPDQFTRQINALDGKIPENVDLADVIQQMDYAAEKSGLDFFSFTPEMPLQMENYYEVTVSTIFEGRYFNMVEFFNHIERLPRTIKPVTLVVVPSGEGLPYLNITVIFKIFFTTDADVELLLTAQ